MPQTWNPTGAEKGARAQRAAGARARAAGETARLEERTREELYELARRLDIAGRSDMSKAELVEAIRRR